MMSEAEEKRDKASGEDESPRTVSFDGSEYRPGGEVGPYKVLSKLGEGGFAEVYLAEQKEPVRRRVALKVIKPGMDSKQVIARFEAERQALAVFDHPNIAQVYDAGTTEAGRPYFVMEHVKGVSLTEHCDQERLTVEERLELFEQVCEAIGYAHQKGIIHRDIKPSNILVSVEGEKPVPKVIDFGVAKAITQPLTERTLFTEQGQLIGTPEYMSPEQAGMTAKDVDTRSDIYSLGVLLYQLLTGVLPFDRKTLEEAGFAEIQRIILEEDPPRPSMRLSELGEEATRIAESRRTEVATLAKRLHKELEWIPLKAMRKERKHRYRSASELADDIQNYLSGAPLIAGPESVAYRTKKFARRNKAWVGGIAAVLAVLVAGVVVSTVFAIGQARARAEAVKARDEANQQASISQAVVDFLNKDLLASVYPDRAKGQQVTVRYVLDAASGNLEARFEGAPLIEASIQTMLGITYRRLGAYEAAQPHLERAWDIHLQHLGEEHPSTLTSMQDLGLLYWLQGRYDKAVSLLVKGLQISRGVRGEQHPSTMNFMSILGWVYWSQARYDKAELLFIKALEISRYVQGEEHPDTLTFMSNLAWTYLKQARYDEAEPLFVKALQVSRHVQGVEHPSTLTFMRNLAWLYLDQLRYDEAETLLLEVLEISRRVLGEAHPDRLESMNQLIELYESWGKPKKAEQWQRKLALKEKGGEK